jgi:hypothetical protein
MSDDEIIAVVARAMGEADRVWYWKDGYPDGERLKEFYDAAARRHIAADRALSKCSIDIDAMVDGN